MMTIGEMQKEILRLKKENDFCILAHAYQSQDILEVADYTGDSYGLSLQAAKAPQKNVLMCGVRFMAETVKMLSPEKRVFLSHPQAGCPMAEQLDTELLESLQANNPDFTTVCYINTTAALKTLCDVCVTSSSAVKIIKNIDNDKILFVPDCNLGAWVAKEVPEKDFKFVHGGCPTHLRMSLKNVKKARNLHPDALLLVHPECLPEVSNEADYVGSTTGIMSYAINSDAKEFIIGTENSIIQHLQFQCPDKMFYPLSKDCVCHNMKLTTLADVYNCVKRNSGEEIDISEDVRVKALGCINKMLELGE
ncbi:quinolinate synthetase [Acetitomaculum ruminis DSM 5522]|uniref:Quinolinate synthase n=1 Tax=Acetitomaculum ruminis DSM 5522 TaxID=1120918 RepID=A0A1I0YAA6_9FIRM|nr:quinolinate synthase NadA [Acetitomaculum ruminis]SFB10122.1 quinolinate synthetase [Acetitomaculum ruminis DSM 5522]